MNRRQASLRAGALAMTLVALLTGCGGDQEHGPRAVALGVDACDYCHMAVDDPLRAAQWVPESGAAVVFDEPGCLLAWLQRHPAAEGQAYVALDPGGAWVPADSALYLAGAVRTGMGFDVVALASGDAAVERPAGGELLSWQELQRRGVADAHTH